MKLELPTRKDIPSVLNERGLIGRAVEVGVHQGKFSSEILKVWRGKCLCSIDPWIFQPEVKLDKSNVSNEEHNDCYKICVEALKPFGNRSVIIRDFSIEASRNFEDSSLDFVYLDARHDYRSVMSDLRAWWPKVKVNGLLILDNADRLYYTQKADSFLNKYRCLPYYGIGPAVYQMWGTNIYVRQQ